MHQIRRPMFTETKAQPRGKHRQQIVILRWHSSRAPNHIGNYACPVVPPPPPAARAAYRLERLAHSARSFSQRHRPASLSWCPTFGASRVALVGCQVTTSFTGRDHSTPFDALARQCRNTVLPRRQRIFCAPGQAIFFSFPSPSTSRV